MFILLIFHMKHNVQTSTQCTTCNVHWFLFTIRHSSQHALCEHKIERKKRNEKQTLSAAEHAKRNSRDFFHSILIPKPFEYKKNEHFYCRRYKYDVCRVCLFKMGFFFSSSSFPRRLFILTSSSTSALLSFWCLAILI